MEIDMNTNKKMTNTEKQAVKYLMGQAGWTVMMEYVDKYVANVSLEPVKADTEFETVWRTAQREAKVETMKSFFNSLEEEVLK